MSFTFYVSFCIIFIRKVYLICIQRLFPDSKSASSIPCNKLCYYSVNSKICPFKFYQISSYISYYFEIFFVVLSLVKSFLYGVGSLLFIIEFIVSGLKDHVLSKEIIADPASNKLEAVHTSHCLPYHHVYPSI